jgi:hypothetical protein
MGSGASHGEKYRPNSLNSESASSSSGPLMISPMLCPEKVRRVKRGSISIPKITSQHFTAEMIGIYILQLSPYVHGGHDIESSDFMNHMLFINYKTRIIENDIDGDAILRLKSKNDIMNLLVNELSIVNDVHRELICTGLTDIKEHLTHSINLIHFSDFKSGSEFPRYPQCKHMALDILDIDLSKVFVVFISHCWLRGYALAEGYDGRPHPDNANHEKFALCVEGIEKILKLLAPDNIDQCYGKFTRSKMISYCLRLISRLCCQCGWTSVVSIKT